MELYRKYRPTTLEEVIGQDSTVKQLRTLLAKGKLPHAILFQGPSGCGKTTLARIMAAELGCAEFDLMEVNCASVEDPSDSVRYLQKVAQLAPSSGKCRCFILDEVQSFSRARFAQQGLLKILEDTPAKSYFMLCTTDPGKLIEAIRTRCTIIKVKPFDNVALCTVLRQVAKKEQFKLTKDLEDKIISVSNGSARQALVALHQVMDMGKDAVDALEPEEQQKLGIDLARTLMQKKKWQDTAEVLKKCTADPEGVRRIVQAYARAVLLNKDDPRAYLILVAFRDPFYDGDPLALLTQACYEVSSQ